MNAKNIRKSYVWNIIFWVALGIFVCFFRNREPFLLLDAKFGLYFCEDRIGSLIELFSITTGIYITMLSILAISATKIMEALLKKRMEQQLLDVMMWGLVSNVIAVLVLVFMPKIQGGNIILSAVLLWAVMHLIYFFFVLFAIFKYNVQNMDKEIDEENKWKKGIEKKMAIMQSDIQEIVKEIKK